MLLICLSCPMIKPNGGGNQIFFYKATVFLALVSFFLTMGFYEPLDTPVIAFLHLLWEKAAGQFIFGAVIGYTLTAYPSFGAG